MSTFRISYFSTFTRNNLDEQKKCSNFVHRK